MVNDQEYSFANIEIGMSIAGEPMPVFGITHIEYRENEPPYYARKVDATHCDFSVNVPFGFVVNVMVSMGMAPPSRYWARRVAFRRRHRGHR